MSVLSRRALLAAPALLLTGAGQAAFHVDGVEGTITVPDVDARVVLRLPIAGREITGIAFAAPIPGAALELVALAGWDDTQLRILGLEVLQWKSAAGALLTSRFASVGDRTRLRIERASATPVENRPRRWESWTDYLAWRPGAPLADAPVRPPLPGTAQARLAALRHQCIALLDPPLLELTPAMLAPLSPAPSG